MKANQCPEEALLAVVRGEAPLNMLRFLNIGFHCEDNRCQVENPLNIEAAADIHDLARGFLTYRNDPAELRRWALFLQAADVDLAKVNQHEHGNEILEALAEAAFGQPLSDHQFHTFEQLK